MKLYLVSQEVNDDYDTYDSFVVCAESPEKATYINPGGFHVWKDNDWYFKYSDGRLEREVDTSWCYPKDVQVKEIGEANDDIKQGEILCASFNAG